MNEARPEQGHEHEGAGGRRRRGGIYLLPNLLTTGALFAGFYAIVAAGQGRFQAAAVAVLVAMVLDGLDGRVARLTQTQSAFGAQLDSLSDMVSFGLAPALVMYEWSLSSLRDLAWYGGKLGWLAAFVYVAGAALRLARFNVQAPTADRRYFQGLPSPAAAAVMVGLVWTAHDLGWPGPALAWPALLLTVCCGGLMVSRFAYYSFKELRGQQRVPFTAMLLVVAALVLVAYDPPKVLFLVFFAYLLSAPLQTALRAVRRRRRQRPAAGG
ncbi:MAG: phosphatidylserine synthase [Gammaproteobacteria bacterium]|nr:MAG: phosphatidylserine synthase [Gammaproteobacteria bacterium]